jgi:hypothetical protein
VSAFPGGNIIRGAELTRPCRRSGAQRFIGKLLASPQTYPSRLRAIGAYREIEWGFTVGDRLSSTAPNRELGVANRALRTIQSAGRDQTLPSAGMAAKTECASDSAQMRHFDHNCALTLRSSQGFASERVPMYMNANVRTELIDDRFAYVAASQNAQISTNDVASLADSLSHTIATTLALEIPTGFPPTDYNELRYENLTAVEGLPTA